MSGSEMSAALKQQITQGEDLATAALREVFGLSFDSPTPDATAKTSTDTKISPLRLFKAEDFIQDGKCHLLLACSGSVATIKLPNMLQALSKHSSHLSIRVVLTASASHFLSGQSHEQPAVQSLGSILGVDGIYVDQDEWSPAWNRGAPILHIELRRWADALVIAPLSANTLAKLANGLCDNLLTSIIRAWDTEAVVGLGSMLFSETGEQHDAKCQNLAFAERLPSTRRKKLILAAPAMNTAMWQHPLTSKQLDTLEAWPWIRVLRPVEKNLACGDVGTGAMKEWGDIIQDIEQLLHLPCQIFSGTAG